MLEPVQPQGPVQPAVMPPFNSHQCIRRLGGNATNMFKALDDLDSHIPPGPIIVHSERAGGGIGYYRVKHYIFSILRKYFAYLIFLLSDLYLEWSRRQVLKERVSLFSRSFCETFAFATSETVSIESGNRLIR